MSPRNQSTVDLGATSRSSSKWISEFFCFQMRVFLKKTFAYDFRESNSRNEYSTQRYLERIPSSCRGTSRSRFRVSEPRARRRGGVPTPNDAEAARRTSENRCEDVHPRQPLYPPARRHAIAPAHGLALACSSMCTGCRGLTPRHVIENKLRADRFIFCIEPSIISEKFQYTRLKNALKIAYFALRTIHENLDLKIKFQQFIKSSFTFQLVFNMKEILWQT